MNQVFYSAHAKKEVLHAYDDLLGSTGYTYEKTYVSTRYGETFLLACGDKNAPPLILLHGSSMNSIMWAKDMQHYGERFRVYAPDLPGEPGRSVEAQLPFDTMDYAEWLSDVMHSLGIDKVSLIGISLGAWLSVKFAAYNAERVTKLGLMCPSGIGSQNAAFKDIALSLLSKGEQGADELLAQISGGAQIPKGMLDYQKLIAASFNSRKEPIPLFTDDALRKLTMPSILYFGADDILLHAQEAVERFRNLVPAGEAFLVAGKGHSLTGLSDQMLAFLMENHPTA